jgi:hypothetical protein
MPEFDVFGDAFFDVSVINSCAESYARRASKGQLEGSGIRYEAKVGKYPELGYKEVNLPRITPKGNARLMRRIRRKNNQLQPRKIKLGLR